MAATPYEQHGGLDISRVAAATFASSQFLASKLNSTEGQAAVCSASTDKVLGIIQDNPPSGAASLIRVQGITKWVAGGAISIGDVVGTDNAGKCVTKSANNDKAAGIALQAAGASGDIIAVLLTPGVYFGA